jgi:hypothetical protein
MDLDRLHKARVVRIDQEYNQHGEFRPDDLFTSRRVFETLHAEKLLVEGFDHEHLFAVLPFSPIVILQICPACIKPDKFETFVKFARAGLIIPALTAPYGAYPDAVVEELRSCDHVSWYEYAFFRRVSTLSNAKLRHCEHCAGEKQKAIKEGISRIRGAVEYREMVDRIFRASSPPISHDWKLFEQAQAAVATGKFGELRQLWHLAWTIRTVRSAKALKASLILETEAIEALPRSVAEEAREVLNLAARLKTEMAEGLGLVIPVDLPVDAFIELTKDLQEQIKTLVDEEIDRARYVDPLVFTKNALSRIPEINREADRLQKSKRYKAIEVGAALIRDHKAAAASVLIAGTLGLAGNLLGCVGALGVGVGGKMTVKELRKRGVISSEDVRRPEVEEFVQMVKKDLQPGLDWLISKYASVERPAVRVLSLRRHIKERTASQRAS